MLCIVFYIQKTTSISVRYKSPPEDSDEEISENEMQSLNEKGDAKL